MVDCLEDLANLVKTGWTSQCAQILEDLDALRLQGMLEAESTCRKLRMGAHTCSPQLSTAYANKKYIGLRLAILEGRRTLASTIRQAKKQALVLVPAGSDRFSLLQALHCANAAIRQAAKSSDKDCEQWYTTTAIRQSQQDGCSVASHLARICGRARNCKTFSIIRSVLKPSKSAVVSMGTANRDSTITEVFDRREVETLALQTGEERF